MKKVLLAIMLAGLATLTAPARAADAPLLWIEGEQAAKNQVQHNSWFESVDPQELSGGAQIANFSEDAQPNGWAEYALDIPAAGAWRFWLRANPCSGIQYQLDGDAWTSFDAKAMEQSSRQNGRKKKGGNAPKALQRFNVAADGTHDARAMTWFDLDSLTLTAGKHTLRFSLGGQTPNTKRFAAIDCFVLTAGDFAPNFQYKPGETPKDLIGDKPEATWAFDPERDEFSPTALLDLTFLNEKVAGEHGFITVSKDGNDFARGDGQSIRFWGGCDYAQRLANRKNDQEPLEHHARFLAKRGVNIVRLHGAIESKKPDSKVTDVDEKELDEIYRLVAGMKKAGIYTVIDPYWACHCKAQPGWGVADSGNGNCTALLFFDPALQRGYKAWLKRIYADPNPYTGIPLAKDPAVAMIQIQNEDSMLFWTMQSVKGQAALNLRDLYGKWVLKKYGSFEKAMAAWGDYKADDDDFAHARPGMFIVWELTQAARNKKGNAPGREARLADQAEFMGRMMYDFNKEISRYLREELGCKQLIMAGNWRSADQVTLDDVERWSYTANDVVAKNHYFTGIHNGLNVGWQILPGQVYTSRSWTKDPIGSPLAVRQVVGSPFVLPESLWVPPSRFEAEAPLIVAGQSSLTGLDTFFWFCTGEEEWQTRLGKWTYSLPTTLGQFPAAALAFRKGYIAQGAAVVHEERSLNDVFGRKLPMIAEDGAWDPNRDTGAMPEGTPIKAAVDPLAFLAGLVEVKYGGDPAKSTVADLSKLISADKKVVRSVTGEITTDLGRGLYLVNAPKMQAVAGFLGAAGVQTLADVTIECKNEYATVAVAALDDQPIAKSGKLLAQVGTESRPEGWLERPLTIKTKAGEIVEARRIVDTGKAPWRILRADLKLTVKNPNLKRARGLDANGNAAGEVALEKVEGGVRFTFPQDALYVVLE